MPRKFAISLIIISTIVYGYIFLVSKQYGTGFFDEILYQMNRMAVLLANNQEVVQTKRILSAVLTNEHPPKKWKGLIARSQEKDHLELFYHYKIWTLKTGLRMEDIAGSYPIHKFNKEMFTVINMRYGNTQPTLQFPLFRDKTGKIVSGLFFPLGEPPVDVDYNNDNIISYEDVVLARKKMD